MTLGEAYHFGINTFNSHKLDDAQIEARMLLCHLLDLTPAALYTRFDFSLPEHIFQRFKALLQRRLNREPAAYITGHREFYGIDLHVDERVLIPRPETELLVETTLSVIDKLPSYKNKPITVADIGTGSGAIAIALCMSRPELEIFAIDRSKQALEVAFSNACRQGVENRITFLCGNLLAPLKSFADVIVANLPYISDSEVNCLETGIRVYEPAFALHGGPDGLDLIEELLIQVSLAPALPSSIILEIGSTQRQGITNLLDHLLPQVKYDFIKDGHGLDRVVKITIPPDGSILQI